VWRWNQSAANRSLPEVRCLQGNQQGIGGSSAKTMLAVPNASSCNYPKLVEFPGLLVQGILAERAAKAVGRLSLLRIARGVILFQLGVTGEGPNAWAWDII
jgi:hypothetical protein